MRVQVERNVLKAGLLEHACNVLADPAETADDHVVALRDGERRLSVAHRCTPRRAGFAEQRTGYAPIVPDEDRR